MIILDTCVIYGMDLEGPDALLLRAIREAGTHRVAVPWMVLEERAAQLAIKYKNAHEKASVALRQLQREAPDVVPELGAPDLEAVREHWRGKLTELVEVLPTSETALREGVYREANVLPPASDMKHPTRSNKRLKVGARDAAIWMSAVEYVRAHTEETVYFVSNNTSDFKSGDAPYPPPMDADVDGIKDRFVHLTSLPDLLELIAPPVEVTDEQVQKLLPGYTELIRDEAMQDWGRALPGVPPRFSALCQASGETAQASGWLDPRNSLRVEPLDVTSAEGYQLGDEEWCIANVRWRFVGASAFGPTLSGACCTWSTRLLMPLARSESNPRILSVEPPQAPVDDRGFEWTADVSAESVSRAYYRLMSTANLATRLGAALNVFAKAVPHLAYDQDAIQRFMEEERRDKIAMDAEAGAAQEAADAERAAEEYGDDLWLGLDH
ncbi:PIN domain-containing protein [Streptomyces sp. 372A]